MAVCGNTVYSYSKSMILMLCVLSLISLSVFDGIATKFLHAAGFASAIYFLSNPKKILAKNPVVFIFISLLLLGVLNILWSALFKTPGTIYTNAYRGPMEMGKISLLSAFIFLVLFSKDGVSLKINVKKTILYCSLVAQILFFIHAMWQHAYLHLDRIILSTSHATTAGYIMMFPALLASILIIKSDLKYKNVLFTLNFLLSLFAIIVTETRAVILVLPFFSLLLILLNSILRKKIEYKFYLFFFMAFFIGIFIYKDTLLMRMNDLNRDLIRYSEDNSRTSVGARLAMYEVGFRTYAVMGQSLEDRAKKIHELEVREPRLSGALPFVDSHLHNDVIETLSTRGVPGIILTMLVFLSILIYALKIAKEPYILVMLFSLLVVGLSDVILFSKPVPTAVFISLILLCAFSQLKPENPE